MVTPTQKIGIGVNAILNAEKDNPPPLRLAKFVTGPKDLSALILLARANFEKSETFAKTMTRLNNDMKNYREKITAEVRSYDGVEGNVKQSIIAKKISEHRRETRQASDAERYKMLSSMNKANDQIQAVSALYRNPVVMLQREGLGTEQRSRYMVQLRNSGPAELEAMAQLAANTGNVVLGAAVLSTIDGVSSKRDRDQINVSRDELSQILVGDQFAKAQEAILISRNRVQAALNTNHQFELGKSNPTQRIGQALRVQNETGILDDEEGGVDDGDLR